MRKREQLLWDAMRRHFPGNAWLQRVENVAGEGMPDVYMGGNGKWIELKAVARIPINRHAAVLKKDGMRQSQINWHIRNASLKHAALSYVLIGLPDRTLCLIKGLFAAELNAYTMDQLRTHAITGPTWADVVKELMDEN